MPNITEVCKKLQNTLKIFSALISKEIEKKQNKTDELKLWTDWAAAADIIHCVYSEAPLAYGDAGTRCVHTFRQEIKALAITLPYPTVNKNDKIKSNTKYGVFLYRYATP